MKNVILIFLSLTLCAGCKTKHAATECLDEHSDFLRSVCKEKDSGMRITTSNILQQHWGERLHTLVLNEQGDTIKEKEFVYIDNNNISIYRDSISRLKNTIDSLVHAKKNNSYIRYTVVEKQSWYKRLMADYAQYIIGLLLIVLAGIILYNKVYRKQER